MKPIVTAAFIMESLLYLDPEADLQQELRKQKNLQLSALQHLGAMSTFLQQDDREEKKLKKLAFHLVK